MKMLNNGGVRGLVCCFSVFCLAFGDKITLSAPKLTEEETESNYLPKNLKCDACVALVYQIKEKLVKSEERSKGKELRESDVIDLLENLCQNGFEDYGLKEVDGVNRLSGPGLEGESTPGMMQMGGKWPRRIRDLCLVEVGDIGEIEVYDAFKANLDLKQLFCNVHCDLNKDKTEL